jgi:hypothetical protein
MSRERPANTKESAKKVLPMQSKGSLKATSNPTLHPHKQQKTGPVTANTGSTTSITFGQIRFDQNSHLLFVDVKKGGEQIRCSITQDALRHCFNATPNFDGMQSCFKAHTGEITKALEKKWLAGKWKDQSKDKGICLEEMDLREFIKK